MMALCLVGGALTALPASSPAVAATSSWQFVDITTGSSGASCGITPAGAAYCWGNNHEGQIGDNTTVAKSTPTLVAGGLVWRSIRAAGNVTCGVTTTDVGYCWGDNTGGALGDGTTTDRRQPEPVTGGHSWSVIAVGDTHTCGITTGGVTYCWGANNYGQGGRTPLTATSTPTAVVGGHAFSSIDLGDNRSCGLEGGNAYCWGFTPLGNGSSSDSSTPVLVSGGPYVSVSAGSWNMCVVEADGDAYCWGWNFNGALGIGNTSIRTSPSLVAGGHSWKSVMMGEADTACGITTVGAVYCWGLNSDGQLGDGTTTNRSSPVLVVGLTNIDQISPGSTTCARTTGGSPFCWGYGSSGNIGDGVNSSRTRPVALFNAAENSTVAVSVEPSFVFSVSAHAGACNGVSQSAGSSASAIAAALGSVTSATVGVAAQDLSVESNSGSGFAVYLRTSSSLTNGSTSISGIAGSNATPGAGPVAGTPGFGYTTSDATLTGGAANRFTSPSAQWAAPTGTNAVVSSASQPTSVADVVCVAYGVAVSDATAAGTYTTSVIYTAVPAF
jgi:alpha-tubulin suppressor-like RCC1 family protein